MFSLQDSKQLTYWQKTLSKSLLVQCQRPYHSSGVKWDWRAFDSWYSTAWIPTTDKSLPTATTKQAWKCLNGLKWCSPTSDSRLDSKQTSIPLFKMLRSATCRGTVTASHDEMFSCPTQHSSLCLLPMVDSINKKHSSHDGALSFNLLLEKYKNPTMGLKLIVTVY